MAYVGAKATKLPTQQQLNPAIYRPGATLANIDSRRIYTDFQSINSFNTIGFSNHNSVQFTVNKQFAKGYTLLAHYTFGRTIDNSSSDGQVPSQNPLNPRDARGLADFHLKHRFVSSFLWELPSPIRNGFGKHILGGWQFNGIVTIQSGSPFDIVNGRDIALCGCGTQRPNLVGDPHLPGGRSRGEIIQRYFNPAAFALPPAGSVGNVGRNAMIGPSFWNVDSALFKNFNFTESIKLSFRAETFNTLNHANLFNPSANISAARVGEILNASDARIIQLGMRLTF